MTIKELSSQYELDDEFERIEDLNFRYLSLKEEVVYKRKELEEAEKELTDFEEENENLL